MKRCSKCRRRYPLQNFYFRNGGAMRQCKLCISQAIEFAPDEKTKLKALKRINKNTVIVENE